MSDLSHIVEEMCAWLDAPAPAVVPTLPTSKAACGNEQAIDVSHISHTSHHSHTGNDAPIKNGNIASEKSNDRPEGSRVTSSYVESVGSVGSVGRGAKTPAESTSPLFPQDLEEVGSVGTESAHPGRPILDLNRAAPQRSDWWSGPAMADADRLAPPPGDPLPISPTDVRAGVARELRALAEDGREGPAALRDAVEITRAKIRNSEALAERQAHGGRCHVCDEPLDDSLPVVAVLSGKPGRALHMHAECCGAYSARRVALVDRIMAAAGYGAEAKGEAA